MTKLTKYLLIFLFWSFSMLYSTVYFESSIKNDLVVFYFIAKVSIFIMIVLTVLLLIKHFFLNRLTNKYDSVFLSILTFVLIIFCFELIFTFIPKSSHLQVSLASWNWHYFYQNPTNNLGFRDVNNLPLEKPNQKTIFFIGDSYTEGYGIKDVNNRFSDKIAKNVLGTYKVYNLGKSGSALTEQIQLFESLPFHPDILVWQFFFNDVDDICFNNGYQYPNIDVWKGHNPFSSFFIKNSYLINYFYFKFSQNLVVDDFIKFVNCCSKDKKLEFELEKRINKIKRDFCVGDKRLIFILIPSAFDVYMANGIYEVFEKVLKRQNVEFINFQKELAPSTPFEYAVNKQDMHINEKASQIIAKKLMIKINQKK